MVVGYYHIKAVLLCPDQRFKTPNPAVNRDNKAAAVSLCLFEVFLIYTVALGKTVRDVKGRTRSERCKRLSQEDSASRAVNVVVAPYEYLFVPLDRGSNAGDSRVYTFKEVRVVKVFKTR